jgi:hypothetical protein
VPAYQEIAYRSVWRGVDVTFRGSGGEMKYDVAVAPGASVDAVGLEWRGADRAAVDDGGNLVLTVGAASVMQPKPASYQLIGGARRAATVDYIVRDERRAIVGFKVRGEYDPRYPLVVDPVVSYSTFLGGFGNEETFGIAVGGRDAYVTGSTRSADYPVTPGAFQALPNGSDDVFVTRLSADGSALVYSTFIGGTGSDVGEDVAVDGAHAFVTGETESPDFPTTPDSFDPSYNGSEDAFVLKLDASGSDLVYSTFLGGTGQDQARGIAVTGGQAYVVGETFSVDFPLSGEAPQGNHGGEDAFVTNVDARGERLVYSTLLGGAADDVGRAIDVRGSTATVTGFTDSADFPATAGAAQEVSGGGRDAFATRFDVHGTIAASTYLGGASSDEAFGIVTDGASDSYVTGVTASADFPVTPRAFSDHNNGGDDAFVTKLSAEMGLVYSTYLGGAADDNGRGIDVDGSGQSSRGNAFVTGTTSSLDFPVTPDAFQGTYRGGRSDAFVTELNLDGSAPVYSTYLGGGQRDSGRAVIVRGGDAYVTGFTTSFNFPTTPGAYDPTFNGNRDVFVTRFDLRRQRR